MWSKLVDVGAGIIAQDYYDLNHCQYHNWQHILDCYDYLEKNNVPYSVELDYAVMHHDIVYDALPEKEKRSADWMLDHWPGMLGAVEPIMATVDHSIKDRSEIARWMIRADLHQLADPALTIRNYYKILNESVDLYGIDTVTFAKNNFTFMKSLQDTVLTNYNLDNDEFWLKVLQGIKLTVDISFAVIKHAQ